MASAFPTVNRRLEEERRARYCGTASLRIASVQYPDDGNPGISGCDSQHVDTIKRMFRQESGCRKEDSRHHAKAIVSQQALEEAVARASLRPESLMAEALPYPELEFPPQSVICIEGRLRLEAADEVLQGSMKRWVFDLYLDTLSDELRLLLSDGYDYQKKPDSGECYVMIRKFQGINGKKNPFFENIWLARLGTNKNLGALFKRLLRHSVYCKAFDELLVIPALYGGFRLSMIHQLLGMKLEEPNLEYLKLIRNFWVEYICRKDPETMRQITRNDVKALQGKAPGACAADHRRLLAQLHDGGLFGNFTGEQRNELWSRVCNNSKRRLIPSLYTFFEDRKYLCQANNSLRKLLDVGRSDVTSSLPQMFSESKYTAGRCRIQCSETEFGSIEGNKEMGLDLAIRQLWLAAFRNHKELPADTQKQNLRAVPRTKANDTALHSLALQASELGFESDKINSILQKSSDEYVAEHALLEARKPGQYIFPDQAKCVRRIVDTFAMAVPTPVNEEVGGLESIVRQSDMPPRRHGDPTDVDHEYDKARLFLPQMQSETDGNLGEMTSTFIRWSVYSAYFGFPPGIGTVEARGIKQGHMQLEDMEVDIIADDFAATRQELQIESDSDEENAQQAQLDTINQQINCQSAQLSSLEQSCFLKQEELDGLNRQIDSQTQELQKLQREHVSAERAAQEKLNELRQEVSRLKPSHAPATSGHESQTGRENDAEATTRSPMALDSEARTHRNTEFDFKEYMVPETNNEQGPEDHADVVTGTESKKIRIRFLSSARTVMSRIIVDPDNPQDAANVEKMANGYMEKGFCLYDMNDFVLNPKDCLKKVMDNGTHIIKVVKPDSSRRRSRSPGKQAVEIRPRVDRDQDRERKRVKKTNAEGAEERR